jgi:hypothetical protein
MNVTVKAPFPLKNCHGPSDISLILSGKVWFIPPDE